MYYDWQQQAYTDAIAAGSSDPSLFVNLIGAESGGNPNAISSSGAIGYGQVLPSTAANPGYGVAPFNPYDPESNLQGSANYFTALQNQFGNEGALNAYNTGSPSGQNQYPLSLNEQAIAADTSQSNPESLSQVTQSIGSNLQSGNFSLFHPSTWLPSGASIQNGFLRVGIGIVALIFIAFALYSFISRESISVALKKAVK